MRILHTADTHIGTRQYGLEERRADFSLAFQRTVEVAIEEEVDAVVHAGDLFDDRYPSAEDLHETLQALDRLGRSGIPFLGVVGNHEKRRGVQWLDLFSQLGLAVHITHEPYELGGARFFGIDYSGRRELELPDMDAGDDEGKIDVLVCHQMLDRVRSDGELRLDELTGSGARFVLLGDYHEHQVWRRGDVLVTYPGSTERWSLDERDARALSLIDLEAGRLDRRVLSTRRFIYIGQDDDPLKALEAHRDKLEGAVVCVYVGRDGAEVREIEEHARDRGALAVRVIDVREAAPAEESAVEVDLEVENVDALVSEHLQQMDLSSTTRHIDEIIRDPNMADSNIDPEVSKLLEALAGPEGEGDDG